MDHGLFVANIHPLVMQMRDHVIGAGSAEQHKRNGPRRQAYFHEIK